jgi:hypothetical protein
LGTLNIKRTPLILFIDFHFNEKFCKFRDDILLYDNIQPLDISCASCQRKEHRVECCRLLNFDPRKQKVLAKFINRKRRKLRGFKRKDQKKGNALFNKHYYQEGVEQLGYMYGDDDEFGVLREMYTLGDTETNSLQMSPAEASPKKQEEAGHGHFFSHHGEYEGEAKRREVNHPRRTTKLIQPKIPFESTMEKTVPNLSHKQLPSRIIDLKNASLKIGNSQEPAQDAPFNILDNHMHSVKSFKHFYPNSNIENVVRMSNKRRIIRGTLREMNSLIQE